MISADFRKWILMLHLYKPTDSGWFSRIENHIDVLMSDHAHLEKRAASTGLNFIFKYASRVVLLKDLAQVVQEEMEHFVQALEKMEERNIEFVKIEPAPYASTLIKSLRKNEPHLFMDKLIAAAFIEARSCERFQILGENLEDEGLAAFYKELAIQEAHHHVLYTNLARLYFDEDDVKTRIDEIAILEWDAILASKEKPRLHSF